MTDTLPRSFTEWVRHDLARCGRDLIGHSWPSLGADDACWNDACRLTRHNSEFNHHDGVSNFSTIWYVGGRSNVERVRDWITLHGARPRTEGWFVTKQGHNVQAWNFVKNERGWSPEITAAIYVEDTGDWWPVRRGQYIERRNGTFRVIDGPEHKAGWPVA